MPFYPQTGFIPKTSQEIWELFLSYFEKEWGKINIDEGTGFYFLLKALTALWAEEEQEKAAILKQLFIQDATGMMLTKRCEEMGVLRKSSASAHTQIEFRGFPGVRIPKGTRVRTREGILFQTIEDTVLMLNVGEDADKNHAHDSAESVESTDQPKSKSKSKSKRTGKSSHAGDAGGSGEGTRALGKEEILAVARVEAQALVAGLSGNLEAGQITILQDSVFGVEEVLQPFPATGGRNEETDEELRSRYFMETQSKNHQKLVTYLESLPDVEHSDIVELEEERAFIPIVDGGDPNQIAQTILEYKPAGIPTRGDKKVVVMDSSGTARDIYYSNTKPRPVYLTITCLYTQEAEFTIEQEIAQALEEYFQARKYDKIIRRMEIEQTLQEKIQGIFDIEVVFRTKPRKTLSSASSVSKNGLGNPPELWSVFENPAGYQIQFHKKNMEFIGAVYAPGLPS